MQKALDCGFAAATLLPSQSSNDSKDQLRIAFDGDAVIFSDEAEKVFQEKGQETFEAKEKISADMPLAGGPFARFPQVLHAIAKQRNGKYLSKKYINSQTELKWQCSEGHIWHSKPNNIVGGNWCHICGKKKSDDSKRGTIEDMHAIAKKRNGKCLSKKYIDAHTPLAWECEKGHIWDAKPGAIVAGSWCSPCSYKDRGKKRRLTIEKMHKLAKEKHGKCLSKEYTNANTHLEWRCGKGHTWKATPSKIKYGQWCPICSKKNAADKLRLTIEEMQEIASNKKGKCLSTEYINTQTPLEWQCSERHIWKATPGNIRRGKWCAKCYKLKRAKGGS